MFPNVEYIKTLVNGLKEFVNSKIKSVRKDIDDLPQPNWNQNDPTAKDYVKNRTHWTAIEEVGGNGGDAFMAGSFIGNNPSLVFSTIIGLGKTYHNIPLQENGKYIEAVVGDYTISYDRYLGGVSVSPNTATVADFNFFYKKEVSHPIPDEYIPDWVAHKDSIPAAQVQVNWRETDPASMAYINNKPRVDHVIYGSVDDHAYTNVSNSENHVGISVSSEGFSGLGAVVYARNDYNIKATKAVIYDGYVRNYVINGEFKMTNIYSAATGLPITEDEVPDGWIVLIAYERPVYNQYYVVCVNPRPKDYFTSTEALPQHAMSADPTEDMQIATKKYVDDQGMTPLTISYNGKDYSIYLEKGSVDTAKLSGNPEALMALCTIDPDSGYFPNSAALAKTYTTALYNFANAGGFGTDFLTTVTTDDDLVIWGDLDPSINARLSLRIAVKEAGILTCCWQGGSDSKYTWRYKWADSKFMDDDAVTSMAVHKTASSADDLTYKLDQVEMSSNPTSDMQIATKKYVDDNAPEQTIQKIESTDQSNMVSIRSIDSGTYILYGYFKPYVGTDSTMTFSSNLLVNILKGDTESHVQVFYPYNNCVQYLKITDSSYERKDTYLGNLMSKTDDVIINSSTEGSTKKFKITVDDTGTIAATEVTE